MLSSFIEEDRKENEVHEEIPTFDSDTVLVLTRSKMIKETKPVPEDMDADNVEDEFDSFYLLRKERETFP